MSKTLLFLLTTASIGLIHNKSIQGGTITLHSYTWKICSVKSSSLKVPCKFLHVIKQNPQNFTWNPYWNAAVYKTDCLARTQHKPVSHDHQKTGQCKYLAELRPKPIISTEEPSQNLCRTELNHKPTISKSSHKHQYLWDQNNFPLDSAKPLHVYWIINKWVIPSLCDKLLKYNGNA